MEMFCLVVLTYSAPSNEVADQAMCAAVVERSLQTMEGLLSTLMAGLMGIMEKLWPKAGALWGEDAAVR